MNHYHPKSKGTWGKEDPKSSEELNRLCAAFFEKLVVPKEWKDMGWKNVIDRENGILYSVGKTFRDMRTNGINLMHYRVYFNSFSTRGGICAKSIKDFGKFAYKSDMSNKTIEKLNEWIAERYNELEPDLSLNPSPQGEVLKNQVYDENDGLQHFRDRFGN
jgi:hypothetical protein